MSNDLTTRLAERHEKRVETGARRYLEQKRKAEISVGEGGVKLTEAEKAELYREMALDPMGVQMAQVLANRQRANKLGPQSVPRDWRDWDIEQFAKMQAQDSEEAP